MGDALAFMRLYKFLSCVCLLERSCGGFTLPGHLVPTKLLYHFPPQPDRRERKSNGKPPNLMGQDKCSLIQQKQMKTKDLFSTAPQQVMSSHFLGSTASVHVVVALEDKLYNNKCCPPVLSLSFYC